MRERPAFQSLEKLFVFTPTRAAFEACEQTSKWKIPRKGNWRKWSEPSANCEKEIDPYLSRALTRLY